MVSHCWQGLHVMCDECGIGNKQKTTLGIPKMLDIKWSVKFIINMKRIREKLWYLREVKFGF